MCSLFRMCALYKICSLYSVHIECVLYVVSMWNLRGSTLQVTGQRQGVDLRARREEEEEGEEEEGLTEGCSTTFCGVYTQERRVWSRAVYSKTCVVYRVYSIHPLYTYIPV